MYIYIYICENVFKPTRPFCYQWFRVSTRQAMLITIHRFKHETHYWRRPSWKCVEHSRGRILTTSATYTLYVYIYIYIYILLTYRWDPLQGLSLVAPWLDDAFRKDSLGCIMYEQHILLKVQPNTRSHGIAIGLRSIWNAETSYINSLGLNLSFDIIRIKITAERNPEHILWMMSTLITHIGPWETWMEF